MSELIAAEIKKMMWEGGNVPGSVAPLTLIDDVRRLKRMLWEGGDVPGDVAEGSAIARVRAVEGNVATLREEVGALHSKIDHLTSLLEGLQ